MTAPDPQYATAAAVAGVAREVEGLRREVERLPRLAKRVESVAALAARVAHQLAAQPAEDTDRPGTWLGLPADTDPADAGTLLAGLAGWMATVYLRYPDAAGSLPDCWLWHPDVVEELLWLWQAWRAAYVGEAASIRAVGDWHDRQRPGVVTRIKATAGSCSIENHQPNGTPAVPPVVPLADATTAIAGWWATHRTACPPAPTPDQLTAASTRRTPRGRR